MRKSLPSLFEPFMLKCSRGARTCPASVLQMSGREYPEVLDVFSELPKSSEKVGLQHGYLCIF